MSGWEGQAGSTSALSRRRFLALAGLASLGAVAGGTRVKALDKDPRMYPVPHYRQEHLLSCEVACLRMAASYWGVNRSEQALLDLLPFEETRLALTDSGRIVWGDPDRGFVGNLDGWQLYDRGLDVYPPERRNVWWWGYGVHSRPVAGLATRLGLHAEMIDSVVDLYRQLLAGSPVIVWVPSGGKIEGVQWSWSSPTGREVQVINREHTVILNPGYDDEQVFVNDPLLYSKSRIDTYKHDEFQQVFGLMSMALAIRGVRRVMPAPERYAPD